LLHCRNYRKQKLQPQGPGAGSEELRSHSAGRIAMAKSPSGSADFVARIVKDPKNPPDILVLTGYVGASSEEAHTRLYFDPGLSNYVEIPNDAILHTEPAGEGGLGAVYVWIKRDAVLTYGPAASQRAKGTFLEGPIMQQYLGAARGGGGYNPLYSPMHVSAHWWCPELWVNVNQMGRQAGLGQPVSDFVACTQYCPPRSDFVPCQSWICPPSPYCPRSDFVPCQSWICPPSPYCPPPQSIACQAGAAAGAAAAAPGAAARPAITAACPSWLWPCPTQPIACPTPVDLCPTRWHCVTAPHIYCANPAAAAAAAPQPQPPPPMPPTLPVCGGGGVSVAAPCVTPYPQCLTLYVYCQTFVGPCPTHHYPCPTVWHCPITAAGCPVAG
jgi:hypothetical protein